MLEFDKAIPAAKAQESEFRMVLLKRKRQKGTKPGESSVAADSSSSSHKQKMRRIGSQNYGKNYHSSSNNTTSSQGCSRYKRHPDEFDVYNIDPVGVRIQQKPTFPQKMINFVKSHGSLFQLIAVMSILCLPGNIVTMILQYRSTSKPMASSSMRHLPNNGGPAELSMTNSTTPFLYVPTTPNGFTTTDEYYVATMAHTDGYRVPPTTHKPKKKNPQEIIRALSASWKWFREHKMEFCMRSPDQALDEPHVTPNEMAYWTDFIICVLQGAHGNSSASKIMTVRHILCDEPYADGEDGKLEFQSKYAPKLLFCVRTIIELAKTVTQRTSESSSTSLGPSQPVINNGANNTKIPLDSSIMRKGSYCSRNTSHPAKLISDLVANSTELMALKMRVCEGLKRGQTFLSNLSYWSNFTKCIQNVSTPADSKGNDGIIRQILCGDEAKRRKSNLCIPNAGQCVERLKVEMERAVDVSDNNSDTAQFRCNSTAALLHWYHSMSSRFCPRIEAMIRLDEDKSEEQTPSYPLSKILDQGLDSEWNRYITCQLSTTSMEEEVPDNPAKEHWMKKTWQIRSLWHSVCNKRDILTTTDHCFIFARNAINDGQSNCKHSINDFYVGLSEKPMKATPTLGTTFEDFRSTQPTFGNSDDPSTMDLEYHSENFTCHQEYKTHTKFVVNVKFWLEGVFLSLTGAFGMLGNLITLRVLKRQRSRSNFHQLLMTLAVVDCVLIVFYVLDSSIIGTMDSIPVWYRVAFPHFLHPGKAITLSSSIFMVVAISAERYKAICYPLRHRPASWQYILFVFIVSLLQNFPKFLEFQLVSNNTDFWTTPLSENEDYIRFSGWWDELFATGFAPFVALVFFNIRIYMKIRASTNYRYRFVCHPHFIGRRYQSSQTCNNIHANNTTAKTNSSTDNDLIQPNSNGDASRSTATSKIKASSSSAKNANSRSSSFKTTHAKTANGPCCHCVFKKAKNSLNGSSLATPPIKGCSSIKRKLSSGRFIRGGKGEAGTSLTSPLSSDLMPDDLPQVDGFCCGHAYLKLSDAMGCSCSCPQCLELNCKKNSRQQQADLVIAATSCKHHQRTKMSFKHRFCSRLGLQHGSSLVSSSAAASTHVAASSDPTKNAQALAGANSENNAKRSNENGGIGANGEAVGGKPAKLQRSESETSSSNRMPGSSEAQPLNKNLHRYEPGQVHIRKRREKSTIILVSIVLIFLFCHMFRFSLQAYEVTHPSHTTAKHHSYCFMQGKFHVPVALYVMISANNFLLVLNSSVNFIVYCLVEETFRAELISITSSWCIGICKFIAWCFWTVILIFSSSKRGNGANHGSRQTITTTHNSTDSQAVAS